MILLHTWHRAAFSRGWQMIQTSEGLSTWPLELPCVMVVGFQEGAFQVAKAEAAELLGPSCRAGGVTTVTFHWPNRPLSQP